MHSIFLILWSLLSRAITTVPDLANKLDVTPDINEKKIEDGIYCRKCLRAGRLKILRSQRGVLILMPKMTIDWYNIHRKESVRNRKNKTSNHVRGKKRLLSQQQLKKLTTAIENKSGISEDGTT